MEIECIGFQKNSQKQVVWFYKLVKDGKNYLVGENNGLVSTFLHNNKNEFDETDLSKKEESRIAVMIETVEKKKINIGRDKDFWEAPLEYFPKYEVEVKNKKSLFRLLKTAHT